MCKLLREHKIPFCLFTELQLRQSRYERIYTENIEFRIAHPHELLTVRLVQKQWNCVEHRGWNIQMRL